MQNLTKTTKKPPDKVGIVVPPSDAKDILTCLYALLWLEPHEAIIFQQKAARLIDKYQPKM